MGNKVSSDQSTLNDNLPSESEKNDLDMFSSGSNMLRVENSESVKPVSFEIIDEPKKHKVRRVETDHFQVRDIIETFRKQPLLFLILLKYSI
jgi:hypothetical protein